MFVVAWMVFSAGQVFAGSGEMRKINNNIRRPDAIIRDFQRIMELQLSACEQNLCNSSYRQDDFRVHSLQHIPQQLEVMQEEVRQGDASRLETISRSFEWAQPYIDKIILNISGDSRYLQHSPLRMVTDELQKCYKTREEIDALLMANKDLLLADHTDPSLLKDRGACTAVRASIKHNLPEQFNFFITESVARHKDIDVFFLLQWACKHNAAWALPQPVECARSRKFSGYEAEGITKEAALQLVKGNPECFVYVFSQKIFSNEPKPGDQSDLWWSTTGALGVAREHQNTDVLKQLWRMEKDAVEQHRDFIPLVNKLYPSYLHFTNDALEDAFLS